MIVLHPLPTVSMMSTEEDSSPSDRIPCLNVVIGRSLSIKESLTLDRPFSDSLDLNERALPISPALFLYVVVCLQR